MNFGLNDNGFTRMRYIDILESMQMNAKGIFGSDVNLNTNSPLGMFLKVVAFGLARIWSLAETVYYSAFKDTATGFALDNTGQYIGIRRKPADYSTGIVTFNGTPGTIIPVNFVIACNDIQFWTLQPATIGGTGNIDVNIKCIELGTLGNVTAGTITTIVNPLTGVTSVTNALSFTGGEEVETDTDFRTRYDNSIAMGGSSTTASIEASLLTLDDVIDADVTENDTLTVVDGIPPKSISTFIYGGTDADISQAIFETKAGGIQAFGVTTTVVTDSKGNPHDIGFTRATEVETYINIVLTKDALLYPSDGDVTIQTAVIDYIMALGLGDDVTFTKIIGFCHKVTGVIDVVVTTSTDNITFSAANVSIDTKSVAKTDSAKVVIS
ncbi:MAG: baseplate J/gp47 family protein [Eubacteriaceae bacterium]|nr:baseplate J/gp47 family protein [Eubacteriaceae bacterium]